MVNTYNARIQLTDAKLPIQMYNDIDKNLQRATSDLVNSVYDFMDKFSPTLPADNKWLLAMTDLLPMVDMFSILVSTRTSFDWNKKKKKDLVWKLKRAAGYGIFYRETYSR